MATRKLNHVLNSGEISRIRISDNIQFDRANVPEADGMFTRFGAGGLLYGHNVPDQDVHMETLYTTDVIPPEAWTEYFSITTTHELTPDNGTFTFFGDFFVIDNKDRTLWIRVLVDGIMIGQEETHDMWKDDGNDHQVIAMTRGIPNIIPIGSVVTLELYGESDGIQMNGAYSNAKLRLTAAQSAPVAVVYSSPDDLGTDISRDQINFSLFGVDHKDKEEYYIEDLFDNIWRCIYFKDKDKYSTEKMDFK